MLFSLKTAFNELSQTYKSKLHEKFEIIRTFLFFHFLKHLVFNFKTCYSVVKSLIFLNQESQNFFSKNSSK